MPWKDEADRYAVPDGGPVRRSAVDSPERGLSRSPGFSRPMSPSRPSDPRDPSHAFLPGPRVYRAPTGRGILDGLTFAVKDVLDVEGTPTGSGNPDWQRTHAPARSTAPAVARCLAAGGRMVGKTICDELAFSLEGANFHYGTPRNPRCPNRLPGGSSSGSAAAVADGLVDGALGSDTGGSVRVPASFCGIFGLRPTHGRIPVRGMTPLAPTYDTVGWFARDGRTLQRFGRALSIGRRARPPRRLLLVADAWELLEPRCAAPLRDAADALGIGGEIRIYDGTPTAWYEAYRVLQGAQIWSQHRAWIERVHPRFGPRTAERFVAASRITRAEVTKQARFRRRVARRLREHVRDGTALVLPASPCIALPRRRSLAARAAFYPRALALNSVAGHSGLPEVALPIAEVQGCPIGIGVVAAAGRDESLLALAASDRVALLTRPGRGSTRARSR